MKIKSNLPTLSTILALSFVTSTSAADGNLFDGDSNQSIVGGTEVSSIIYLSPSCLRVFFASSLISAEKAPIGRYSHTVALSASGFQFCGKSNVVYNHHLQKSILL
jgi:hypothetical protein